MSKRNTEESFWSRLKKTKNCWVWTNKDGSLTRGYGGFSFQGRVWKTHRLAWTLMQGDPGSLCVLHKCDNPPCCNPDHLFLGTKKDNNLDKKMKGRSNKGQKNSRSYMTNCKRGHSMETCIIRTDGNRKCRICHNERTKKYRKTAAGS